LHQGTGDLCQFRLSESRADPSDEIKQSPFVGSQKQAAEIGRAFPLSGDVAAHHQVQLEALFDLDPVLASLARLVGRGLPFGHCSLNSHLQSGGEVVFSSGREKVYYAHTFALLELLRKDLFSLAEGQVQKATASRKEHVKDHITGRQSLGEVVYAQLFALVVSLGQGMKAGLALGKDGDLAVQYAAGTAAGQGLLQLRVSIGDIKAPAVIEVHLPGEDQSYTACSVYLGLEYPFRGVEGLAGYGEHGLWGREGIEAHCFSDSAVWRRASIRLLAGGLALFFSGMMTVPSILDLTRASIFSRY